MSARARFTQADMKRATAGVLAAGLTIAKIVIDPTGKIVIIPSNDNTKPEMNEWGDLE